jgi:hypothetical protein
MREYHREIDKDSQMFDFKSFYESVGDEIPENARLAEIGLSNGKSSIFLAEYLHNIGKPIDRFIGVDNCAYGGQDQRNEIIRNIVNAGVNIEFFEMSSLDASCKFPDNYFDFIFIDSSHTYHQTKAEIWLWYKKLKIGGVLAGHDYLSHQEVKDAVDEIIPTFITRPVHDETIFEPTKILTIEETEYGSGIWYVRKEFFGNINY